jgi:hypothetical protein
METAMSESTGHSRWRHFLMMLPFFVIGVAIPVYFFGFSGDGPPQLPDDSFRPEAMAPAPAPGNPSSDGYSSPDGQSDGAYRRSYDQQPTESRRGFGLVSFARGMFESVVDTYISPNLSPLTIKLGFLGALFVGGFLVLRVILAVISGTLGGIFSFLVHKAAGPMFVGFMAVGSTWGIHQTIADQFGMTWAATTVSLTAAVATLFALAGVKLR